MEKIVFDIEKLTKSDRKTYDSMTDSEKKAFESTWIRIEELKAKQQQMKNASRVRATREKKVLAEKERKERNHRLIERGAILEAYITDPLDFSNDEIKEIVAKIFTSDISKTFVEEIRSHHNS